MACGHVGDGARPINYGERCGKKLVGPIFLRDLWWLMASRTVSCTGMGVAGVVVRCDPRLHPWCWYRGCRHPWCQRGGHFLCRLGEFIYWRPFGRHRFENCFFISCILSVPGCLNGVIGVGFAKAFVRSNAAIVAASTLETPGTLQCLGKNYTVSLIRACPVVEQYTRWAQSCSIAGPTYQPLRPCGDRDSR
jgi:hypothetical protein